MKKRTDLRLIISLIIVLNFIFANNVYAYIDPNTGGFFFTSILPFVYGALAAIVVFWKRIVNVVKGFFSRNKKESGG